MRRLFDAYTKTIIKENKISCFAFYSYQILTYRMKLEEVKTVIIRYIFGYYNT